jgi:DNA-binding response OmpR family regulator
MERPQAVISRQSIVSKVWGEGAIVSPTAMNMQIKGLREKLGESRDAIQTVRGTGFKIS